MSIELDRLLARGDQRRTPLQELENWFQALQPLDCAFMLGQWSGGVFNTGHPGEPLLKQMQWIGKDFRSSEDVEPIVCRGPEGERVVSPLMGAARMRMVQVGADGPATASMIYDKHPVIDHFKRIDACTVLGVMDRKGDAFALYFYLRRLA